MTSLRFRTWGSDEWTFVRFEGEDSEMALGLLATSLLRNQLHVQQLIDGQWENL